MSNKPVCVLQSPIWTRSGYGDLGLAVAKSLLRYDKFELLLAPTVWGACSKKNLDDEIRDPEGLQLLSKILRGPFQKQPEVFIQITIPNEYVNPGKFNIGYTAGIETTLPKPEWIEGLNRMNLNLVTSIHARNVFEQTQYSKKNPDGSVVPLNINNPLEVLFWGADTNIYKKTTESVSSIETIMSKIPESFGFLFVGQWTSGNIAADRKAIGYLINTFLETFKDTKNAPCLILKSNGAQICNMDKYDCLRKIKEITSVVESKYPTSTLPNVYLIHGELAELEMNALYNHPKIKLHTSFTHGEGYGHPLLLATLSGKPVIASNWSGHLDFLNPAHARFFEGQLEPIPQEAINDWFVKDARWFNVDYTAAGQKMKNYFNNYSEKILKDAELLRAENEEKFSIKAMDKAFHSILDKYVPKFSLESTIVLPKLKKINLPKFNKNVDPVYYSQYKQDKFLNENVFHNKMNGVFLDIGAFDGITCSNTYFFETQLQWNGVCIEPHPIMAEKLKLNRKCNIINKCAWKENTTKIFRVINGESDMLSGILECYDPKHLERVLRDATSMIDIKMDCIDINNVLDNNNLNNIDLLSIDTEGGEFEIIKHIDFARFNIATIVVENQYDPTPIRDFLNSKGYNLLAHLEIDDIFIKK